ncbi:MAG TPA: bifunctional adenosylcobinamide kinase/adenosylcobinamide-phosphate guanylyltransferase, partial [Candidatus Sulfotelmatobacter sp.]|nr:bifunctional adenosylcobinamide kinase/adenosylcobinamide-phosphate guanylyltransferase [Candidatus Sulfotelmatobacter sp.]
PQGCLYIATAEAGDAEMVARIRAHRARRGARWRTVEAPLDIAGALARSEPADGAILVDCLTLWLANLMAAGRQPAAEAERLAAALRAAALPVVLVANEVGLGIVPDNALGRAFRDHAGRLNQAIAAMADAVVLMVAGLPLAVKPAAAATVATP